MTIAEAIAEITRLEPLAAKELTAFQANGDAPHWRVSGRVTKWPTDRERYVAWFPAKHADDRQCELDAKRLVLLGNTIMALLAEREAMREALEHSLFGMDAKESREWEAQSRAALNLANQPLP